MIIGSLLSTSAARHSEECQRVVGALGRAAVAEFDLPGESRWIHCRIERRRHGVSEPGEYVDAAAGRRRVQHQRVVPERQVLAAIVEDGERDLSRRLGIDDHVPRAGDYGGENGRIAVTQERAARKRAMVRLCGRGRRRTRRSHEDQRDKNEHACGCDAQMW